MKLVFLMLKGSYREEGSLHTRSIGRWKPFSWAHHSSKARGVIRCCGGIDGNGHSMLIRKHSGQSRKPKKQRRVWHKEETGDRSEGVGGMPHTGSTEPGRWGHRNRVACARTDLCREFHPHRNLGVETPSFHLVTQAFKQPCTHPPANWRSFDYALKVYMGKKKDLWLDTKKNLSNMHPLPAETTLLQACTCKLIWG